MIEDTQPGYYHVSYAPRWTNSMAWLFGSISFQVDRSFAGDDFMANLIAMIAAEERCTPDDFTIISVSRIA